MKRDRGRPPGRHRAPVAHRSRLGVLVVAAMSTLGIAVATLAVSSRPASDTQPVEMSTEQRQSLLAIPPQTSAKATEPKPSPQPEKPIPATGSGQFAQAEGSSEQVGDGVLTTYRVEVERELPWKTDDIAAVVDSTLGSERGWIRANFAFQRRPDSPLRIVVATPKTVDRLCAPLKTRGEVSCRNGNIVAINAKRWQYGIKAYASRDNYRRYVINHEVGHALGYGHLPCPDEGRPAPVMQQQSISMQECRANPWPTADEIP